MKSFVHFLIVRKALDGVICLLKVFSYIRLRRCCRLPSKVKQEARNVVEGGSMQRHFMHQSHLTEPQGISNCSQGVR